MKSRLNGAKAFAPRKRTRIRTSILEIMRELSKLTNDDNLVVAAVKNIFGAYDVRLAGVPMSVRLVNTDIPDWAGPRKNRRQKTAR